MKTNTNKATIAGRVVSEPAEYECCGETFYSFMLATARDSGTEDVVPVNISKYLMKEIELQSKVCLVGQIRTYNKAVNGKNRLLVVFFAQELKEYTEDLNQVELTGYFCKKPQHRVTPLGRDICDALLAVNRERGKSDYVPCIVWGRTAQHIGELEVGAKVKIQGRLQSRVYNKKTDDGVIQQTAYEVSVNRIAEDEEADSE